MIEAKRQLAKAIYTKNKRKETRPVDYFEPISNKKLNQKAFLESPKKNKSAFGGNRAGKTEVGAYYCVSRCLNEPNLRVRASTWADMQLPVQMAKIYSILPKDDSVKYAIYTDKRGFTNKIIIFKNGSTIRFKTYDQGQKSFQGADLDIEWADEEPPEDILKEMKARLIDRAGTIIRTMTPLNGLTYTYDEVVLNEKGTDLEYWYFDSAFNPYISQAARNEILNQYPDKEKTVRSKGTFMNLTSGLAYYSFSEQNIIEEDKFKYLNYRPLELTWDFNVDIMTVGIHQEQYGNDYLFDYVELEGQANTDLLCDMIMNKFVDHKGGWIHYGDISGNSRTPNASRTNWAIIRDKFPSSDIHYQNIRNIHDRVTDTNGRLEDGTGTIHYFVTKNCKRHISDFRKTTWEMLLNKTKAGKVTHASDGISYMIHWKYPLRGKLKVIQR